MAEFLRQGHFPEPSSLPVPKIETAGGRERIARAKKSRTKSPVDNVILPSFAEDIR